MYYFGVFKSSFGKGILGIVLVLTFSPIQSQADIQAWFKKGQVWIVWENTDPKPEIYEIYQSETAAVSTNDAVLIGKLTEWDWMAGAIRDQLKKRDFNWNIPHPTKDRSIQLDTIKNLFVYTPHAAGSSYFAVVKQGETVITSGVNGTASAVSYSYDPFNDPVTCHLQSSKVLPSGHNSTFWAMWADGQEEHWNGRPDFPVMANPPKNGQPNVFIVSEAIGMDTTQGGKIPATLWLHGGKGKAFQSLPNDRPEVNIMPQEGILVAHNDDFAQYLPNTNEYVDQPSNTQFFGWAKNKDPYDLVNNVVLQNDTVVNYTQRRLDWTNDWLIKTYNVDPERIHVNGHSMGSGGVIALMKAYPDRYATATIFNNGLDGYDDTGQGYSLFGDKSWNNPTNLYRRDGTNVHVIEAFNLTDLNSEKRDLPLVRMFHGKNDSSWSDFVVDQYKDADSLGFGMQLYWSERGHGLETWWLNNDHWTYGVQDNMQTIRENVAYEETKYRNMSFPAFFDHRLDEQVRDPGDGTEGTSTTGGGSGDDWGTFGGYHDWNTETLMDEPCSWQVTAWLIDGAVFANDNSPQDSLMASLAIRKPQHFLPEAGTSVYWTQIDSLTNTVVDDGVVLTDPDGLVAVDSIVLHRYPEKSILTFSKAPLIADPLAQMASPAGKESSQSALRISAGTNGHTKPQILLKNTSGKILGNRKTQKIIKLLQLESVRPGEYELEIKSISMPSEK
ncbi:hypothetical protein [Pricia sp.]|uniref:alpha/beta hydrolase family protein n=1 Tax=Pricia sp. TaxID=2268138 RepID=UPI003594100C